MQIVNSGFVRTELTEANRHPMPFLMASDVAARRLCDGLVRGGFEIRFPLRLALLMRVVHSLPYPAFFALLRAAELR